MTNQNIINSKCTTKTKDFIIINCQNCSNGCYMGNLRHMFVVILVTWQIYIVLISFGK